MHTLFIVCLFHCLLFLYEDNNARNGSRKKKQRNDKTHMGEIHHICLVRWQQQAGINFADSHNIILGSGKKCPKKTTESRPREMVAPPYVISGLGCERLQNNPIQAKWRAVMRNLSV